MPCPEPARRAAAVLGLLLCALGSSCRPEAKSGASALECTGCNHFADGRNVLRLRAAQPASAWPWQTPASPESWWWDEQAAARLGVSVVHQSEAELWLRAGTVAGELWVGRRSAGRTSEDERAASAPLPGTGQRVRFHLDPSDADHDGLPDVAEFLTEEERAGFTAWFTAIAEAQHTAIDDRWATLHQDCAGLVRFAFREAARAHDAAWLRRWRFLPTFPPEPALAFRYPALPWLGDLPFRQDGGVFTPAAPVEAHFTAAPSARTLWLHNSWFVTREVADARAGDLLFFRTADEGSASMHTMIALGSRPGASHRLPATRVVYHTGLAGEAGEVRLVTLAQLLAHPDPAWRPTPHNPRFLGVYRLHHLVHMPAEADALALRARPRGA